MKFKEACMELTAGNVVFGSLGAGAGFLYGKVYGLEKKLTIKAFAIATLTINTFRVLNAYHSSKDGLNNPDKSYYLSRTIVIDIMMGIVGVIASREMGLIARKGTAVLSLAALTVTLVDLYYLFKHFTD